MRLPSPTTAALGAAPALSSHVVVYLIIESTCVTSRRAFSCTESSYTVGLIWGRPRLRKPRLEPHKPARNRPPPLRAPEARIPGRQTPHLPSLRSARHLIAARWHASTRFSSRLYGC